MGAEDPELAQQLRELATAPVEEAGAELLEVIVKGYTGSRVVRLIVDSDDGIDIGTITTISRHVEAVFDDVDAVAGSYMLQVTSPGADRPLTTTRDFARNVGRSVTVVVRERDGEGPSPSTDSDASPTREVAGVLEEVVDGEIVLDVDGTPVTLAVEDVERGQVQLPW